ELGHSMVYSVLCHVPFFIYLPNCYLYFFKEQNYVINWQFILHVCDPDQLSAGGFIAAWSDRFSEQNSEQNSEIRSL
ncbi:MAG TPA: hypothetical protein VGD31_12510, partial [Sphingobacteriaceae bacterium]